MTEHYITLFDSLFLPQGLALHASLERHAGDFHLWVIAMDGQCREALTRLDLPHVTVVPLSEVENDALLSVKGERSIAEYCWTLTPFTPDVVFDRDSTAKRATYIDADMWLARNPQPIFEELESSGADSLITPHAYSPRYESNLTYGIYCVQFMPFTRDGSRNIRERWQGQCIDWCSSTPDATRFGDQKYLDNWPADFGSHVRVLAHSEWTQAPWNVARFAAADALTFHFHRLRLRSRHQVELGLYAIPRAHIREIYHPYLRDLRAAIDAMTKMGIPVRPQAHTTLWIEDLRSKVEFRLHNLRHPLARQALRF